MSEEKKILTEQDILDALPKELDEGIEISRESQLADFAYSAREIADEKLRHFKTQTQMSQAYDEAQKYTPEEVIDIIYGTNSQSKAALSRYYYDINALYKSLILYYTTMLTYDVLVVPNYDSMQTSSKKKKTKMYRAALQYLDMFEVQITLMQVMFRVLRDGVYYGIVRFQEDGVAMQKIPRTWARPSTMDIHGNYTFELDLRKFSQIYDNGKRNEILQGFPKNIKKAYDRYLRSGQNPEYRWFHIDAEQGLCLFTDESLSPFFVSVIEDINSFQETKTIENERAMEELSKLIVHKIPLNKDNEPIFTIPEAKKLHAGLVNMFAEHKYIDVITSFGEVTIENVQNSGVVQNRNLETKAASVYSSAGVSKEVFSSDKNTGLKYSVTKDTAIAFTIMQRVNPWLTHQLNSMTQIGFSMKKYSRFFEVSMLFLSHYNREEYIKIFKELASSG